MQSFEHYKKLLKVIVFYDYSYDDRRPSSIFSSDLSHTGLILRFLKLITAFPLSLLAWVMLRIVSTRYKVSIYVLKTFRPGFASTYINMMEPLCRQLQHENNSRHIKILVEPGEAISDTIVKSYEPHFTMYLDDRRKFARLIAYLIPKSGLEKKFINTSDKFNRIWSFAPSTNYFNKLKQIPNDLRDLGIRPNNFVLFAHPSRNYYQKRIAPEQMAEIEVRFLDLSLYRDALEKVTQQNLFIVRVGLDVDVLPQILQSPRIIDYAEKSQIQSEQLWLYENCKFVISASCGAYWLARRFNRPSILTDNYGTHDIFGYFSTLWTPRLVKDNASDELLSFSKLLSLNNLSALGSASNLKARQLSYIQNSSSVLVNAMDEMLGLEDGTPKYSASDTKLLDRYHKITRPNDYVHLRGYVAPCISFLREYPFLLE